MYLLDLKYKSDVNKKVRDTYYVYIENLIHLLIHATWNFKTVSYVSIVLVDPKGDSL